MDIQYKESCLQGNRVLSVVITTYAKDRLDDKKKKQILEYSFKKWNTILKLYIHTLYRINYIYIYIK